MKTLSAKGFNVLNPNVAAQTFGGKEGKTVTTCITGTDGRTYQVTRTYDGDGQLLEMEVSENPFCGY